MCVCLYIFSQFSVTLCGNLERWDSLRKAKRPHICHLAFLRLCPSSTSLSPGKSILSSPRIIVFMAQILPLVFPACGSRISPHTLLCFPHNKSRRRNSGVLVLKRNANKINFILGMLLLLFEIVSRGWSGLQDISTAAGRLRSHTQRADNQCNHWPNNS